jgi:hypothetical protein
MMKHRIYAALVVVAVAGAPLAAFAADGPRPSSYHDWPGMMQGTAPASEPTVTPFDGTRPSSLDNWHGMTGPVDASNASSADPVFDGPRPSPNH